MKPKIDFGALFFAGVVVVMLAGVWGILAQRTSGSAQSGGQAPLATGYPGPAQVQSDARATALPFIYPTLPGGTPNPMLSAYATPSPDEKVVIAVSEVRAAAVQPTPTYSFDNSWNKEKSLTVLHVTNPTTGKTVQLGDNKRSAIMGSMTDEFVAWYTFSQDLKQGLHIYWFATNKDTWVTDKAYPYPGSIKIGGRWVAYMGPTDGHGRYAASLSAYNVDTGQNVLVADDAFFPAGGMGAKSYFAINEDMVAWVGNGAPASAPLVETLNMYDLLGQKRWQIPAEIMSMAQDLSVSHDAVVWREWYWKGYTLAENAIFTVPVLPPGLDKSTVKDVGPVTVQGNTLQWALEIDGQEHHFTASIAAKPQGSAPGTDRQQEMTPTPLTINTPVPVTVPTSYP